MAEKMPESCDHVLDGALFTCWSLRNHPRGTWEEE